MTKTVIQEAIEAEVLRLGWRLGTALENQVAITLSRSRAPTAKQQYTAGKFRLDFAWPERKIALEADGWWHRSPEGAAKDRLRDSWLRSQGWVVFRVDDENGPYSLQDQVERVARIVGLHPELPKPRPKPRPGGCQAQVAAYYEYEENSRPCMNKAVDGPYCRIHAKSARA